MNPHELIGPASPLGYPAPYWFLVFFKVLGFTLHLAPMNLWYGGLVMAMVIAARGGPEARRWSARLMRQMPLIVALGVNFGVVPLLFLQVTNYRVFYPATILMAWPWLSIILLLTVAYYGVYIYGSGLKGGRMTPVRRWAGWVSAVLFIAIGFLFANAMSLMVRVDSWRDLFRASSVGGAVLGTALNTGDHSLWPRWLMMMGLAFLTSAVHVVFDAGVFGRGEGAEYRRWAPGFGVRLYLFGLAWFAVAGAWYAFGTWPPDLRAAMFGGLLPLTVLTAGGPAAVLAVLLWVRWRGITPAGAWLAGLVQFLVLGLNAISRQTAQNIELRPYLDVTAEKVIMQWSPLVVFLLVFAGGVGVVIWMVRQLVLAGRVAPGQAD